MTEFRNRITKLAQVVNNPKKHLLYYRHSLADGERMDISANTVKDKGCLIPVAAVPSESLIQKLFADVPKEETSLNILYCPLSLQLAMQDGLKPGDDAIYPFWIPAELSGLTALLIKFYDNYLERSAPLRPNGQPFSLKPFTADQPGSVRQDWYQSGLRGQWPSE